VRDGGNASMYGFTMRWYNAGVSRTMWICCLEYCTRRVHDVGSDAIMRRSAIDLANVHLGGRVDDIDFDVWSVFGMAQPAQHPRILKEERTSDPGYESSRGCEGRADDVGTLYELGRRYEAVGEGGQCSPFDADYSHFRLAI